MPFTFRKEERLCNFRLIEQLFAEGKSFVKYPFRVVFLPVNENWTYPAQVIMSVSKKRFKRANKRNLIRRRMKEAYRLNKIDFYDILDQKKTHIAFAVIYLPTEVLSYNEIETGIKKVIAKFDSLLSTSDGTGK